MPAEQKGSVYKTAKGFGVRWSEQGRRRHQSGFATKTAARNHFRDEVAPRLGIASSVDPSTTLKEFVRIYPEAHALNVEASTLTVLKSALKRATDEFGDVELRKLERKAPEIAAWRAKLKEGSRVGATKGFRQALDQAIAWGVISKNPVRLAGKNRAPKRAEIIPYTKDELDHICGELKGNNPAIVRFAAATGMRPCEWLALEWRDVRKDEGVVLVERTFSRGKLRAYGKTSLSRRRVPLSRVASDALATVVRRIDTPLIFPSPRGEIQHLENWRPREWKTALDSAGIDHGNVYTLRHCFATNALAAGLSLFDVARFMGTSVVQISKTYGHLAQGAEAAAITKLDAAAGGSGV